LDIIKYIKYSLIEIQDAFMMRIAPYVIRKEIPVKFMKMIDFAAKL
jgi:hypothetical protein